MNPIGDKKFWKYFSYAFTISLVLVVVSWATHFGSDFFFPGVPLSHAMNGLLWFVLYTILRPVSIGLLVAVFIWFRRKTHRGEVRFTRCFMRSIPLVLLITASMSIYYNTIGIICFKENLVCIWEASTTKPPEYLFKKMSLEEKRDMFTISQTADWFTLTAMADSLEESITHDYGQCDSLQRLMPDSVAMLLVGGDDGQLEWWSDGVDWSDSLQRECHSNVSSYLGLRYNIRQDEHSLRRYKDDLSQRMWSPLQILVCYCLGAVLGYLLRNFGFKKKKYANLVNGKY